MKKLPQLTMIVAMLAGPTVCFADTADKPDGVADKDWISISEKFGFVIDEKNTFPAPISSSRQVLIAPPDALSAELMPPAKGYFVVKTSTGWRRIAMTE